jgi:hypothetical protein
LFAAGALLAGPVLADPGNSKNANSTDHPGASGDHPQPPSSPPGQARKAQADDHPGSSGENPGDAPDTASDPPGNNGTVKIDGLPWDDAPNNEPHPGCTFEVDFYGFDQGDLYADVTFEAVAPTAGGVLREDRVFIGEDQNDGGGSTAGLDASARFDLSDAVAGIAPHPKQGWHVRLTVHADGSQGADVKHKVFWIAGCERTSTPEVAPGDVTPSADFTPPAVLAQGDEQQPASDVHALSAGWGASVLGMEITRAGTPPGTGTLPSTGSLPRTGGIARIAPLGLGLVLLGWFFRKQSRRVDRRRARAGITV